jgi:hypothetical protein
VSSAVSSCACRLPLLCVIVFVASLPWPAGSWLARKKKTSWLARKKKTCDYVECRRPMAPPAQPLSLPTCHQAALLDLPLEVLTCVCQQLDLRDLVRIAETCTRFRHGDGGLATAELPTKSPVVTAARTCLPWRRTGSKHAPRRLLRVMGCIPGSLRAAAPLPGCAAAGMRRPSLRRVDAVCVWMQLEVC